MLAWGHGGVKGGGRDGWQVEMPAPAATNVEMEVEAKIWQARMQTGFLDPVRGRGLRRGDLAVADVTYVRINTGKQLKHEVQFLDTNNCENCALLPPAASPLWPPEISCISPLPFLHYNPHIALHLHVLPLCTDIVFRVYVIYLLALLLVARPCLLAPSGPRLGRFGMPELKIK